MSENVGNAHSWQCTGTVASVDFDEGTLCLSNPEGQIPGFMKEQDTAVFSIERMAGNPDTLEWMRDVLVEGATVEVQFLDGSPLPSVMGIFPELT